MVPVKYEARFKNWTNSLLVEQVFTEFKSDFFPFSTIYCFSKVQGESKNESRLEFLIRLNSA